MKPPCSLSKWQDMFAEAIKDPFEGDYPHGLILYREFYRGKIAKTLNVQYATLAALLGEAVWIEQIIHPYVENCIAKNLKVEEWIEQLPRWLLNNNNEAFSSILIPLSLFL